MSSKSVSQIFKTLFHTGDTTIYVFRGVFFSRYVLIKSSFSDEKEHQWLNLCHTLVEKLLKINLAKYERKIPSVAEVEALQSYA